MAAGSQQHAYKQGAGIIIPTLNLVTDTHRRKSNAYFRKGIDTEHIHQCKLTLSRLASAQAIFAATVPTDSTVVNVCCGVHTIAIAGRETGVFAITPLGRRRTDAVIAGALPCTLHVAGAAIVVVVVGQGDACALTKAAALGCCAILLGKAGTAVGLQQVAVASICTCGPTGRVWQAIVNISSQLNQKNRNPENRKSYATQLCRLLAYERCADIVSCTAMLIT